VIVQAAPTVVSGEPADDVDASVLAFGQQIALGQLRSEGSVDLAVPAPFDFHRDRHDLGAFYVFARNGLDEKVADFAHLAAGRRRNLDLTAGDRAPSTQVPIEVAL
jgi:hypothetical protein